jgi:hypothetical protein
MDEKSEMDAADLVALGVSSELVGSLSVEEAGDLLKSLIHLREKYHVAISRRA